MIDRKTVQDLFIRICKDSDFQMKAIPAMQLTAKVLEMHPLMVWVESGLDFSVMDKIADGTHPVCRS